MKYIPVNICVDEYMKKRIDERGNIEDSSCLINRDLTRLYEAYESCLKKAAFSIDEADFICASVAMSSWDYYNCEELGFSLDGNITEIECIDDLKNRWSFDRNVLRKKIAKMSRIEFLAIIDAVERFERLCNEFDKPVDEKALLQLVFRISPPKKIEEQVNSEIYEDPLDIPFL